jgi:hypothetical protein
MSGQYGHKFTSIPYLFYKKEKNIFAMYPGVWFSNPAMILDITDPYPGICRTTWETSSFYFSMSWVMILSRSRSMSGSTLNLRVRKGSPPFCDIYSMVLTHTYTQTRSDLLPGFGPFIQTRFKKNQKYKKTSGCSPEIIHHLLRSLVLFRKKDNWIDPGLTRFSSEGEGNKVILYLDFVPV